MATWDDDGTDWAPLGDPGRRKRNDARRSLLGGVAGVAMLVGPIALANSIIPGSGDVSADDSSVTALIARREASDGSAQYDSLQMKSLAERITTTTTTTTTTTAPPTTTTTTSPPMTAPDVPPLPGSGELGDPNLDASWDALAECESTSRWSLNSGNGYYGGLQFALGTWRGLGGTGYPHEHPREVQIAMGKKLWQTSGWGAWPGCTAKLGWRS